MSRFKGAVSAAPNNWKSVGLHDAANPEQDPMPVTLYSSGGVEALGPKTGAGSLSVVPATDADVGHNEDAPHVSGDRGAFVLTRRKDSPASSAGSDGDYATLDTDANGAAYVNLAYGLNRTDDAVACEPSNAALKINSAAYEASHIIKASAGKLLSLIGYNSKGSAQFIQLYDSATLPADTAVPVAVITVPASSNFEIPISRFGMPFATGIVVGNSSTGPTKTIGSADCYFTATYV